AATRDGPTHAASSDAGGTQHPGPITAASLNTVGGAADASAADPRLRDFNGAALLQAAAAEEAAATAAANSALTGRSALLSRGADAVARGGRTWGAGVGGKAGASSGLAPMAVAGSGVDGPDSYSQGRPWASTGGWGISPQQQRRQETEMANSGGGSGGFSSGAHAGSGPLDGFGYRSGSGPALFSSSLPSAPLSRIRGLGDGGVRGGYGGYGGSGGREGGVRQPRWLEERESGASVGGVFGVGSNVAAGNSGMGLNPGTPTSMMVVDDDEDASGGGGGGGGQIDGGASSSDSRKAPRRGDGQHGQDWGPRHGPGSSPGGVGVAEEWQWRRQSCPPAVGAAAATYVAQQRQAL
ncbi:unnamed protein product, partial [Scytosiphon promiscuus]